MPGGQITEDNETSNQKKVESNLNVRPVALDGSVCSLEVPAGGEA